MSSGGGVFNKEDVVNKWLADYETKAKETGERPWPGFCQSCKAALYPPDRTDCPSCGACD